MQPPVNHTGGILATARAQLSQRAYEEAADRDAAEQADAERTAAEHAAAERVAAERAAVERAAAEQAAIEDDGEYPAQLLILITDVRDEYKVL